MSDDAQQHLPGMESVGSQILNVLKAVAQVAKEGMIEVFQHPPLPNDVPYALRPYHCPSCKRWPHITGWSHVIYTDLHLYECISGRRLSRYPFARRCEPCQMHLFPPLAGVENG